VSASGTLPALRALAVCLLLGAAAAYTGAQGAGYAVEEMLLLPPRFYVGDPVELRLRLRLQEAPAAAFTAPDSLPEDPWFDLHRVQIDQRGAELRVRVFFTPFRPGASVLPALRLGELELAGVEVSTASVLEGQEKPALRGLRGPLRIPFTGLRLLAVVLAVTALPAAVGFAARGGLRGLRRLAQRRRRRRPYLRLQRAVARLRALRALSDPRAGGGEQRDFFILLSQCLKRYLSERLGRSLMSATTAEVGPQLAAAGVQEPLAGAVLELLARADRIKFSGRGGGRREMHTELCRLERIAGQIEESCCDVES